MIDTAVQSVNIGIHSAWRKASDRTLWRSRPIVSTGSETYVGHATEENTKGDQKVLQLGYKKLTYYVIYTVIFRHMLLQHQCIFQLFFSAVYALKIEFSVLTLKPCLNSDLQ